MVTAINVLLNEMYFNIPREIINLAFTQNNNYRNPSTTVDDEITTEVLRKRVMVDLNLASQETVNIPLQFCETVYRDISKVAYFIPKTLTNGRSIISVHNTLSNFYMNGDIAMDQQSSLHGSSILGQALNIRNNLDSVSITQTARIDLIGENTILIDEGIISDMAVSVTAVLENDTNLNNINPRAFKVLAEGFVLAVKAHIYTNTIITLNKGIVYAGHELSIIKDIIDEYREANQDYNEWYKTKWKKAAFTQNDKAMEKYVSMMLGNVM